MESLRARRAPLKPGRKNGRAQKPAPYVRSVFETWPARSIGTATSNGAVCAGSDAQGSCARVREALVYARCRVPGVLRTPASALSLADPSSCPRVREALVYARCRVPGVLRTPAIALWFEDPDNKERCIDDATPRRGVLGKTPEQPAGTPSAGARIHALGRIHAA